MRKTYRKIYQQAKGRSFHLQVKHEVILLFGDFYILRTCSGKNKSKSIFYVEFH